ncbi:MAG: sugar transferase [Terriglobia bacterium]|jgi:lipopolysaccharide/colanic/teichoic acid biosynthesis glycosyltransferase|nr:sugar transferase [Terriglobia bacterium]
MADSTVDLGSAPKPAPNASAPVRAWDIDEVYSGFHYEPIPPFGLWVKRCLDLLIAIPAAILLLPAFILVAVMVKIDSRGPALYRSIRVGKGGRRFTCYKFRSMVANADDWKEHLRSQNQRQGPTFKIHDDPRLTRLGPFIRRYSIDELPQFWNIIRGEMSIVGPRPHPFDDVVRYQPEHMRRCVVKPGLTCLWQVEARRSPSFDVNMELDMQYIQQWSLLLDCKIILHTFAAVLRGDGQ